MGPTFRCRRSKDEAMARSLEWLDEAGRGLVGAIPRLTHDLPR